MGRARTAGVYDTDWWAFTTALFRVPNLPTVLLNRLAEAIIDELDRRYGDPDMEPEEERCSAGDDGLFGGPVFRMLPLRSVAPSGSDDEYCV